MPLPDMRSVSGVSTFCFFLEILEKPFLVHTRTWTSENEQDCHFLRVQRWLLSCCLGNCFIFFQDLMISYHSIRHHGSPRSLPLCTSLLSQFRIFGFLASWWDKRVICLSTLFRCGVSVFAVLHDDKERSSRENGEANEEEWIWSFANWRRHAHTDRFWPLLWPCGTPNKYSMKSSYIRGL